MPYSVATRPGEGIAGEKITYAFGKARDSHHGLRVSVSLGLEGTAFVVRRWRRVDLAAAPAQAAAEPDFDSLTAWSADGCCDTHTTEGKVHRGSHRKRTGVLCGNASVVVVTPRDA